MFASEMLDVAIGMIFIYLLLSLICSALNELIERSLKNRAKDLEAGLRELLNDPTGSDLVRKVYEHGMVNSLFKGDYDPSARDKFFIVKETQRGGSIVTTLQPRDRGGMIRDVSVTSSASDHTISRIDYGDREGNRTSFDLSGYHAAAAGAETFHFTPPAGTQVVNAQ